MQTIEDLLRKAEILPDDEFRQLRQQLEEIASRRARSADKPREEDLDWWMEQAGIADSDFDDVSTDKYKHLAEVYVDDR